MAPWGEILYTDAMINTNFKATKLQLHYCKIQMKYMNCVFQR